MARGARGVRGAAMKQWLLLALLTITCGLTRAGGLATGGGMTTAGVTSHAARSELIPDPALYVFREHPGARLPAHPVLRDSLDRPVRLREISAGTPLILILGYFRCANLCGVVRASLFRALAAAQLEAGRDYALAVLSIDPTESSADARAAKAADLAAFASAEAGRHWHYLTGTAADIGAVSAAVGFNDRYEPDTRQFIHPTGVVFVTREGIVSNYLLGVGYTPQAVRSALERAGAGRIAVAGAPLLLICFHFDPTTGRYSLEIMKLIRLAALLTILTAGGALLVLHRRGRRGA